VVHGPAPGDSAPGRLLSFRKRVTVLDCGCGTGGNICAFPPEHRRIGVDPSPDAIAIARAKCPGVEFVQGMVPDDVAAELAAADLVLLTDVLEHVEGDRELLSGIVGGMKPGAHLLITVPADPGLWSPHDVAHGHFRRYTAGTLPLLWKDLPVEVRLLSPFNRRLYPLVWLARQVTRALGRGAGAAGTDLRVPPGPLNRLSSRSSLARRTGFPGRWPARPASRRPGGEPAGRAPQGRAPGEESFGSCGGTQRRGGEARNEPGPLPHRHGGPLLQREHPPPPG
jgi:SAM-dependent methyltransferase